MAGSGNEMKSDDFPLVEAGVEVGAAVCAAVDSCTGVDAGVWHDARCVNMQHVAT